jgi:uncharacterized protein YjlB
MVGHGSGMSTQARLRARLAREGLRASAWANGPFERYPEHRHHYDKVLLAAAGDITFHLPELGQDIRLETGDRLDLPAGTLHGADVGVLGVTCLEAHLPAGALGPRAVHMSGWAAIEEPGGETRQDPG